jgi:lactate permease
VTLASITGLSPLHLSAGVGRICAPVSLFVPAYLILVMGGMKALKGVLPAAALCGLVFAGTQFAVSNFVGPELTDILSSLASIGVLVILFKVWQPKDKFVLEGEHSAHVPKQHPGKEVFMAWLPYLLLVVFVLLWARPLKSQLEAVTVVVDWPGLHNQIQRMPPVVGQPTAYAARYTFNWLAAAGTSCIFAAICGALLLGMSVKQFGKVFMDTNKQLALPMLTIASVLGLAFLMNYSGATTTLGLAFVTTGVMFPFFSSLLGWLGVFLTGSDTSSNALFGNLQVVTANTLGLNPILMASANSAGGVMGKMISLQSIAVAAAATNMKSSDEALLFRFTLRHSIFLACVIGLIVMFYSYVTPGWRP